MGLVELMADLRATKRPPTLEEAELIAREGSFRDVADAMNLSHCLLKPLTKRYRREFTPGRVE